MKGTLTILFLFSCLVIYSQDLYKYQLEKANDLYRNEDYKNAKKLILPIVRVDTSDLETHLFMIKVYAKEIKRDSIKEFFRKTDRILKHYEPSSLQKLKYFYWKGYCYQYLFGLKKLAINEYMKAIKNLYLDTEQEYISNVYQDIIILESNNPERIKQGGFIKQSTLNGLIRAFNEKKNFFDNDTISMRYHYTLGRYFLHRDANKSMLHFNNSVVLSKRIKNSNYTFNSRFYKGVLYSEYLKNQDSARILYNRALNFYQGEESQYMIEIKYRISKTYLYDNNPGQQKRWLSICYDQAIKDSLAHNLMEIHSDYAKLYFELKKYKEAYTNLEQSKYYYDLNNYNNMNLRLSGLQLKYKLRIWENLYDKTKQEIEIHNLQNQTKIGKKEMNFTLLLILIVSVIIIWLINFQISKRKRIMILRDRELESQKNLALLKELEISTINAMVEGQEKERKRVAEDLHDNLGSVIATLKLHFDNLRINQETKKIDQEILFDKTEELIDEAYKKVRSIAHAKNAGVIANKNLLIAIRLMAEKASSAHTIQIEVIESGLDKAIENSLEITIFRIIQELTTNVIKHARASFVTIGLNYYDNELNIMVDDNGVGMDSFEMNLKKGMGLHSIKTRIEHLEGSFTIDSTLTKGTTIIINIPI